MSKCKNCFLGFGGNMCVSGHEPVPECEHFIQKHVCRGGLVHDHKITPDECRECAKTCKGCIEMAVAYGFVEMERVAHLLKQERRVG
ncbi:hypothetical protein [Desulfoscipio geothermicus]|uniref:Uncharacterized protein n=1 Tax=Desulfoscipio geothermicus DSM 3669 TaxID=1121426 RepID=A0A1I6ECJ9_9FIRM|nr:hypothetical protein [Desulfoscipio geothermicus]SFR15367.1 hypothetical protein SAMN05660706_13535 [Desulfoscipio geothermicus DSM 3669]